MHEEGMTRRGFLKVGAVAAGTVVVGGVAAKAATYAPEPERPSLRMGDGDMKALVVYGTKTGCTAGIAEQIGKTLAEQGFSAEVMAAEKAGKAADYDAVVVGSGIRAGQWHGEAKGWLEANAEALKGKPVALYSCCLSMSEPGKEAEVVAYTDPIIEATGIRPVSVGAFAGWNEPKTFSFVERTILKLMKAPQGDFRDMAAVAAWTEGIAPKLSAEA